MRSFFLSLFLLLPLAAPLRAETELTGLTAREAGAVRKAVLGLNTSLLRGGREQLILEEAVRGTPTLSDEERARIEAHLLNHVPTMTRVQELLNLRQRWRKRSVDLFKFWWHPSYRSAAGLPARSPTTLEAMKLEAVARDAGARLGIEPPRWMPYRIDPRAEAPRAYPRSDLRWGVTAADAAGFEAVVELIAQERGGVPGLWKPLGRLLGGCHDDEPCREQLLAAAEASAGEAGLVPVLEVLTAGTLGDLEDPAFATALLFADELLAGSGPEELAALLEALEPGLTAEETRRVLRAEAGVGAQRVDRSLRRRVDAGRRDRLGR